VNTHQYRSPWTTAAILPGVVAGGERGSPEALDSTGLVAGVSCPVRGDGLVAPSTLDGPLTMIVTAWALLAYSGANGERFEYSVSVSTGKIVQDYHEFAYRRYLFMWHHPQLQSSLCVPYLE
jgi:hypothetical protein